MKDSNNLLIAIYQNAKTGSQSIMDLICKVKNKSLKNEIEKQQKEYEKISNKCEQMARQEKMELKQNSWFEKTRMWTSIKLSLLFNNSTRKIAEMMLLGTVMGTTQIYKSLEDFPKSKESIKQLARLLNNIEENFYNNLKTFLNPEK